MENNLIFIVVIAKWASILELALASVFSSNVAIPVT